MEGELQQVLGDNLRAYRAAQNLSQEGFADVLGVHRTYVGAIERGEKNLSLRSVERLATRLQIPPLVLLTRTDGDPPAPEKAGARRRRRGRTGSTGAG